MFKNAKRLAATPNLPVATLTMFFLGFTFASTAPYISIIGVDQLHLSTGQFSLLNIFIAIAGMCGTLVLGYLSDHVRDRKTGILFAFAVGAIGYGAFALLPRVWSFIICVLLVYPISSSAYSQLFAVVRTQTNKFGKSEAVEINSLIRSIYALSWILVPGLVGLFIATRTNTSDAYAVGAVAFILCFVVYAVFGKSSPNEQTVPGSALAGMKLAFLEVTSRRIFLRILALGLIATIQPATASLLPLFVKHAHAGSMQDIGIIAGLTAGLEIPFMLLGGYFSKHLALWKMIIIGGIVHACYFIGLGFSQSLWQIYALTLLNAAGGAIMLTLHLSYVQNLMPDKPGLGTSLLGICALLYRWFGAILFASVYWLGTTGAFWLGALLCLAGCVLLFVLDGNKHESDI